MVLYGKQHLTVFISSQYVFVYVTGWMAVLFRINSASIVNRKE